MHTSEILEFVLPVSLPAVPYHQILAISVTVF